MAFDYRLSSGPLHYTHFQLKKTELPYNCRLPDNIDACLERPELETLDFGFAETLIADFEEETEERARQHQERNERLFRSQQSIEEEEERLKQTLHDSFVEMKVTEPEEPVLDEFAIKEAKINEVMEAGGHDRNTAIFFLECTGFDVQEALAFAEANL